MSGRPSRVAFDVSEPCRRWCCSLMSPSVSDLTHSASADALLEALDPEQRAVATTLHGPVVVMAGAGTGKTRAITHRIAYGVRTGTFDPLRVLAVTFTQRAAGEMRGRLAQLGVHNPDVATRHERHFQSVAGECDLAGLRQRAPQ